MKINPSIARTAVIGAAFILAVAYATWNSGVDSGAPDEVVAPPGPQAVTGKPAVAEIEDDLLEEAEQARMVRAFERAGLTLDAKEFGFEETGQ